MNTLPDALTAVPDNINILSPLSFKLIIKRAPHLNFFIQKINIPGMSLPAAPTPSPFVKVPQTGDHVTFDPLICEFKVDEDLQNYFEMHAWMRNLGKVDTFEEYASLKVKPYYTGLSTTSEVVVMILNSARSGNFEIIYHDAWPTRLSGLQFDTTLTDVAYVTAQVEFDYTLFEYNKIS